MSYLIHDCETTTVKSYKRVANPFDDRNHVVANGFKRKDGNIFTHYYGRDKGKQTLPIEDQDKILVGFNYKFDLLWHWHLPELQEFFRRGGKIWCCQYAEYLLEGQIPTSQMCSMDDLAPKYGGTLKIDEVKAMWKAGIDTVDIPEDLLLKYLGDPEGSDISNTEKIFLGQVQRARKQGQLIDIMERMEGLLATTEMEYNGLYIDVEQAKADQRMLEDELSEIQQKLDVAIPELPEGCVFLWSSNVHKSCLLFGGSIKYEKWTPYLDEQGNQIYAQKDAEYLLKNGEPFVDVDTATSDEWLSADKYGAGKRKGEYKTKKVKVPDTTKPKGRKVEYSFALSGYTTPEPEWKSKLTDAEGNPVYKTGKEIIEILGNRDIDFLKALANREKIAKDLGTYYSTTDDKGETTGMLTCVMPNSIIHHKLNHNLTVTTRLSSSDPNLQNIPRADFDVDLGRAKSVVKRMFRSRFTDGCMLEIDYSQLEVVVQGFLSNDPQLIADLIARVDFHCKRLAAKLHADYQEVLKKCKDDEHPEHTAYKKQRTGVKQVSFQLAYGAGAKSISCSTGLPQEEVEAIIAAEHVLYPGVNKYYDYVQAVCEASRYPTMLREPLPDKPQVEVQLGRGFYLSPTQARFVFTEVPQEAYLRKRTGKDAGFYRPFFQNYPIQGVGGQLVQYVLGRLFRFFNKHNNFKGQAFMVNTVHDCVWFDCINEVFAKALAPHIIKIMQSIPEILKELFNIDCPVPFPVEAEYGPNMLNLKGVH